MTKDWIHSGMESEQPDGSPEESVTREEEVRQRLVEIWDTQRERLTAAVAKVVQRRGLEHDPESIMMSAAASCLRGNYEDYDSLNVFGLLLTIADRKAVARLRRHLTKKRGEGRVYRDADLTPFTSDGGRDSLVGTPSAADPTTQRGSVSAAAETAEEFEYLLAALLQNIGDSTSKKILLMKADGCSTREIAVKLDVSESTIKRKWSRVQAAAKAMDV